MEDQNVNSIQSFENFESFRKIGHKHLHVQLAHFHSKVKSACEVAKNVENERAKQQETDDGFSDDREKSEI
jgi:hypothetical protein